jgi:amino acid transporter
MVIMVMAMLMVMVILKGECDDCGFYRAYLLSSDTISTSSPLDFSDSYMPTTQLTPQQPCKVMIMMIMIIMMIMMMMMMMMITMMIMMKVMMMRMIVIVMMMMMMIIVLMVLTSYPQTPSALPTRLTSVTHTSPSTAL